MPNYGKRKRLFNSCERIADVPCGRSIVLSHGLKKSKSTRLIMLRRGLNSAKKTVVYIASRRYRRKKNEPISVRFQIVF